MLLHLLLSCAPSATCEVGPLPDAEGPRCGEEDGRVTCAFEEARCAVGAGERGIRWQVPAGEAPAAGWPGVLLFQGSLHPTAWTATAEDDWGALHQVRLTAALLQAGYAVLAPETRLDGAGWWQTNELPWSQAWEASADHALMLALFLAIEEGALGPLDPDDLHAAGISSGGYMTSRMAASYPGRFRTLAIQSAGWATCAGPLCVLPDALPASHPPTLFLHGEQDPLVPLSTMQAYAEALEGEGVPTRAVVDPDAGHAWIQAAPDAVLAWVGETDAP